MFSLEGQYALVTGIANADSIAWGCAQAMHQQGAKLAITWLNEKAEKYVRPLAESLDAEIMMPLDLNQKGQLEAVFETIGQRWGRLDTMLHSIAFAPKADLHGRVVDCSAEGFCSAMDISVHSFLRMMHLSEPLMSNGGTCMTVTFLGSVRVVPNYNLMGPVKAALESAVRYAAAELGEKGIRVHALSPGPMATRASSGLKHFDEMLAHAASHTPTHQRVTLADIGALAAFLASPAAHNLTGGIHQVDGGYSLLI